MKTDSLEISPHAIPPAGNGASQREAKYRTTGTEPPMSGIHVAMGMKYNIVTPETISPEKRAVIIEAPAENWTAIPLLITSSSDIACETTQCRTMLTTIKSVDSENGTCSQLEVSTPGSSMSYDTRGLRRCR